MFHLFHTIWRLRLCAVDVFLRYLINTGQGATYDERHIRYRVTYTGVFHKNNYDPFLTSVHMCTDLLQLAIQTTHVLFLKIKNLKISLHRSHLFQQKISYVFDLIICQLIYLHRTVTKILFLPCYHLAFEVYMFLFLT